MQPQPQSLPAEIIFPPLPPTAYTRFRNAPSKTPEQTSEQNSSKESPPLHHDLQSDLAAPPSDASSILSIPELTPNRSSSSPPPSLPLTSEVDLDDYIHMDQAIQKDKENDSYLQRITTSDGTSEADTSTSLDGETDIGDDSLFRTTTLGPVQYWGETPKRGKPREGSTISTKRHEPTKNDRVAKSNKTVRVRVKSSVCYLWLVDPNLAAISSDFSDSSIESGSVEVVPETSYVYLRSTANATSTTNPHLATPNDTSPQHNIFCSHTTVPQGLAYEPVSQSCSL